KGQHGEYNPRDQNRVQERVARRLHSNRSQLSPSNPRGGIRSTTIMSAYITALDAAGQNWIDTATDTPTNSPLITAPPKLPSPPMVTTTKAGMMAASDIEGTTLQSGAASTPAMPATAVPRPNTAVKTLFRLMPSMLTISGSRLPARMMRPYRVPCRNSQSAARMRIVTTSTNRRYFVTRTGPHTMKPDRKVGGLNGRPAAPQMVRINSSVKSAMPKVMNNPSSGSLP